MPSLLKKAPAGEKPLLPLPRYVPVSHCTCTVIPLTRPKKADIISKVLAATEMSSQNAQVREEPVWCKALRGGW